MAAQPESAVPIRRARSADLDALCELWLAITRHHETFDPYFRLRAGAPAEARRLLAAWLRDPDAAAWIAGDATPLGLCLARIDRAPPIQEETIRAEISDLGVRPEARRRGLATALLDGALVWVREQGAARVEVRVAARNPEGQAFWRARGFGDFMDVLHRRL